MRERSVLLIENDPLNRKVVHAVLSLHGYRVHEAGSPEAGLALAREKRPDCILMAIPLPSMDGLSALRLLKQDAALRDIPVIALSASPMGEDERKSVEAGFDAAVSAPIRSAHILETVQRQLERTAPPAEAGNARILIVDDEPMSARLLSAQLKKTGWVTQEASGGEEAIRAARENPPDLILMDVMMPGMDGYETTRRLKRDPQTMRIPIILVTGLRDIQDKVDGLEAGANEFLSKPVDAAELMIRIKNLLKLREYEEQLRHRAFPDDFSGIEPAQGEPTHGSPSSARILVLEGAGGDGAALQGHLDAAWYRITVSGNNVDQLQQEKLAAMDLVILDADMTGLDTFEICRQVKDSVATKNLPFVVMTGTNDPESRVRYLALGVDDLLPRPVDPRELAARVGRLVRQKLHLDKLQSRYQAAVRASNSDGLTALFNHAYFQRLLDLEIKRSLRKSHPTSLILMDLDDFKSKNDTFGHVAGDFILSEVSRRIRSSIREIDMPARYGGEEFAVVLPYTDSQGALVVAERIRTTLATTPFFIGKPASEVTVTASIGVSTCPENGKIPSELIHAADSMMYRSKLEGKNKVRSTGFESASSTKRA